VKNIARTRAVWNCAALNISIPISNRIPASSAAAIPAGIFRMSVSNQPVSPAALSSTAQTMKAPIASG
jgi:hypothetical protein